MDAIWTPGPLPRLLDSELDPDSGDFLRLESTDYVAYLVIHVLLRARSYGLPFSSCWTKNLVFYIGTLPCSQAAGM